MTHYHDRLNRGDFRPGKTKKQLAAEKQQPNEPLVEDKTEANTEKQTHSKA